MKTKSVLAVALLALTALTGAAQPRSNPLSSSDRQFVTQALRQATLEAEVGRLAQVSSAQPTFLNAGRMLERDPANIRRDLATVSKRHGLRVPTRAAPEDRREIAGLLALRGGEFDELFKTTLINNKQQQLQLFRLAARDADSPDVRRLATRAIPVIESHLRMARELVPNRTMLNPGTVPRS